MSPTRLRSLSRRLPARLAPFYDGIAALAAVAAVWLAMQLWYRWLRPDPQFLQFTANIAQLVALTSLLGLSTTWGRRVARAVGAAPRTRRFTGTPARRCLSACAAACALAAMLYAGSPAAAALLNRQGSAQLAAGYTSAALANFRRAASLAPNAARTHYNLANALEARHDDEEAISEYQAALELDETLWPAANNLGRLFITARSNPEAALDILLPVRDRTADPVGQAVIAKNVGWADLAKGLPHAALAELEGAQAGLERLQAEGANVAVFLADVHRLSALAHEAVGASAAAQSAWADCLAYALSVSESAACGPAARRLPADCLNALRWAGEARAHLGGAGTP